MASALLYGLFLGISLLASILGAICGIGGGVLMKPLLDSFGVLPIAAISFLCGCTVLSMSTYTVMSARRDSPGGLMQNLPIAFGGAVGGILGKWLFQFLLSTLSDSSGVGRIQSACLLVVTGITLIYTVFQSRIRTHHVHKPLWHLLIGLALGLLSAFLGIGGGPINLMALSFFFSMNAKTAARTSLSIILFSQATSLFSTIITHTVPSFDPWLLLLMALGGIGGGILGRKINAHIDDHVVRRLFCGAMVLIIGLCLVALLKS